MKPPSLKAIAALNTVAFIAVASSFAIPLLQRVGDWNTAEKLKAQQNIATQLQISDLEKQRQIADAARDNAIAQFDQVVIYDYVANPADPPALDWLITVDPAKPTYVFDKYRACVGMALDGKLTTIFDNPNICDRSK